MRKTLLLSIILLSSMPGIQKSLIAQEKTSLNQVVNTLKERISPVSYTHLDVYKRQGLYDTTYVFAAIICIILLSMFFNLLAVFVNKYKLRIIRFATMKYGK